MSSEYKIKLNTNKIHADKERQMTRLKKKREKRRSQLFIYFVPKTVNRNIVQVSSHRW